MELDLAERWSDYDWTNPDSEFVIFPREQAEKLREIELQRQKEEAIKIAMARDTVSYVPDTPKEFYEASGPVILNNKGQPVEELAEYQWEVWNSLFDHHYTIVIKSQKIGLTTVALWADFQLALLPRSHPRSCRGQEILIIAQTLDMARRHLQTLREMIVRSQYKDMLITKPTEVLFRDQVTKVGIIYIKNPDDHTSPTRIIGLGPREGSIWSFKQVKHIHVSDIVASDLDYSQALNAALTRLANTDGTMLIETPPRGPQGRVYEIWQKAIEKMDDSTEAAFWPIKIPVDKAVKAGIITQAYLDNMRVQMGAQYNSFFNAEFIAIGGNAFRMEDVDRAVHLGRTVNLDTAWNSFKKKSMGIDPGHGSSAFGIVITQVNGPTRIEVIYARQFADKGISEMIDFAYRLALRYNVNKIFMDANNPGHIMDMIARFPGQRRDYKNQINEIRGQKQNPYQHMKVNPVNFGNDGGRSMMALTESLLEGGFLAIPDLFSDLIVQLRSAQLEFNGDLDKEQKNSFDTLDALRLALQYYNRVRMPPPRIQSMSNSNSGGGAMRGRIL